MSWGVMYAEEEFSETFFETRKIKNPFVFSVGDKSKYQNTFERLNYNSIDFKDSELLDYVNLDLNNFYQINISRKNIKKDTIIDNVSINEIKNVYQIMIQILKFYQIINVIY